MSGRAGPPEPAPARSGGVRAGAPPASAAGIVLAGGRSSRMGRAKAALPWAGTTLLAHMCAVVGRAVGGPVVVVRAPGQALPALPAGVEVAEDPREGLGPVQGLAAGLAAVADRAEVAYLSATDMPLLRPELVRRVLAGLDLPARPATASERAEEARHATSGERAGPQRAAGARRADVALPVLGGHHQPLAAAYRTALAPLAAELVAAGRLRPADLYARCRVHRLDERWLLADPALAAADPRLESLTSVDTPAAYAAARRRARR